MVAYSTAEICSFEENEIRFRLTQPRDVIVFDDIVPVKLSEEYEVLYKDGKTCVYSKLDGRIEEYLTVRFEPAQAR